MGAGRFGVLVVADDIPEQNTPSSIIDAECLEMVPRIVIQSLFNQRKAYCIT